MSSLQKLYSRIKNNPNTVRFEELEKILTRAGFSGSWPSGGSSHKTFRHANGFTITVPHKKPYVLACYVKKAIELIDENGGIS